MKSCVLRLDGVDWINWTGLSLSSEHVLSVRVCALILASAL